MKSTTRLLSAELNEWSYALSPSHAFAGFTRETLLLTLPYSPRISIS